MKKETFYIFTYWGLKNNSGVQDQGGTFIFLPKK